MHKTKKAIDSAVHRYIADIEETYPGIRAQCDLAPSDGHDAWVILELTEQRQDLHDELMKATYRLSNAYYDADGVSIVAIITTKQPEGANHG